MCWIPALNYCLKNNDVAFTTGPYANQYAEPQEIATILHCAFFWTAKVEDSFRVFRTLRSRGASKSSLMEQPPAFFCNRLWTTLLRVDFGQFISML